MSNNRIKREIKDGKIKCSCCKEFLEPNFFSSDKRSSVGKHCHCKNCKYKKDKEYRDKDPQRYSNIQKQIRLKRKEKFKEQKVELTNRNINWNSHLGLKNKYGITLDEYIKLWDKQDGKCAICGEPEKIKSQNGTTRALSVDHDHETGQVRDLLCSQCNQGIGCLKDSVEILEKASNYIRKHKNLTKTKQIYNEI